MGTLADGAHPDPWESGHLTGFGWLALWNSNGMVNGTYLP
jgi:hypothetical protein